MNHENKFQNGDLGRECEYLCDIGSTKEDKMLNKVFHVGSTYFKYKIISLNGWK